MRGWVQNLDEAARHLESLLGGPPEGIDVARVDPEDREVGRRVGDTSGLEREAGEPPGGLQTRPPRRRPRGAHVETGRWTTKGGVVARSRATTWTSASGSSPAMARRR